MPARGRRAGAGTWIFVVAVAAFLAFFLLYPVGYILKRAFIVGGEPTASLFAGLAHAPTMLKSLVNSLLIGVAVTALSAALSAPLAILTGRYTFAGRKWLTGLMLVPMIMPPFVGAIGMKQLFSRNGAIDIVVVKALSALGIVEPATMGVVDIMQAGLLGVIVLEALHLYPIMYLNIAAALANVDPALEEAARNMGASSWRLFRTVTLPLMMPGFFAGAIIVFIWGFTDLGTPLVLNFRDVVPVQIFNASKDVNENPLAFALVVIVILLCVAAFLVSKWFAGRRTYYMLSKNTRGKTETRLGLKGTALAYAAFGAVTLAAVMPHVSVVLMSLTGKWFRTALPTEWTLEFYQAIFTRENTLNAIKNSLVYSAGSTAFDIVIGVGLAYILARRRLPGKGALDAIAMLPLALPGFVLAFGYVAVFVGGRLSILDPLVNPTLILMVSYSVRRLPFMVRSVYAGLQQMAPSLEEASENLGATPGRTLRKITLPLVFANILAGSILAFSFAMLEVSDSLILATERTFYPIAKEIYVLSMDIQSGAYLASAMGVLGMALLVVSLVISGKILGQRMGELFRA
jgi:iron(III) transport system permease protein